MIQFGPGAEGSSGVEQAAEKGLRSSENPKEHTSWVKPSLILLAVCRR